MKTTDFDYELPPSFIAQTPAEPRDSAKLMVLNRADGLISHHIFREISDFLQSGDLLVVNHTRVIPARMFARKIPTGGKIEVFLLRQRGPALWETLVRGKGMGVGKRLTLLNRAGEMTNITGEIVEVDATHRVIRFSTPLEPVLPGVGHVPLPPYIHDHSAPEKRYQTIYAKKQGSVAAPTAGLHFTESLMTTLREQGVNVAEVTLHIGLDTFAPVNEDDPREHHIHSEWCQLSAETADQINQTKRNGGRVICVGTTSVRTVETAAQNATTDTWVQPWEGPTNLYILPGYDFRAVDAMITNFHLPKSTLIMMISALVGRETILGAYEEAKAQGYRFYSFGDAMLIL